MDKTFAGQNKCNPKSHDRPFVIEWDATDMSQFESIAANDVVFVKYEGCELRVIDSCRNDSLKGALGAYKPVEWTSGSVEKIDIANENDLYAKLPLGAATLGGRVASGEAFHMEYFVSGTRSATRPAVFKDDVAKIPGCRGATHFVYGFNLGAFALGSTKNLGGKVDATVWGIGVGGTSKNASAAEKRGGMLESCTKDGAKELATCKVPVRLTLRAIEEGADPDKAAAVAPETGGAMNLAGKVDANMKRSEAAQAHADAAQERRVAGDGKACIKELDEADRLDPRPFIVSTNPRSYWSSVRAQCLMIAGQCQGGRQLFRKGLEANNAGQMGPEQIDTHVDAIAAQFCRGGDLSVRDRLLQANRALMDGSQTKKDAAFCRSTYDDVKKLAASVPQKDADDVMVKAAKENNHDLYAAQCFARAGDCSKAWDHFFTTGFGASSFHAMVPHCSAFTPPESGPKADPAVVASKRSLALKTAVRKVYEKDATCLADWAEVDRLAEPGQRGRADESRALCLMVAGRCDEGEKVQREALTAKKVSPQIIDANVRSIRQSWCKR